MKIDQFILVRMEGVIPIADSLVEIYRIYKIMIFQLVFAISQLHEHKEIKVKTWIQAQKIITSLSKLPT